MNCLKVKYMSVVSLGESNVSVNQIIDMYYSPIYAVEAFICNGQEPGKSLFLHD